MAKSRGDTDLKVVSLAVTGSGGAGVMTIGDMLLEVAAKAGYYGLMTRSTGPQIRGGEAAALLSFSNQPVAFHKEQFDLLLALDWLNTHRFAAEIVLDGNSMIIGDSAHTDTIPAFAANSGGALHDLPFEALAREIDGGRINMIGLGVLATLLGMDEGVLQNIINTKLASKGQAAIAASDHCLKSGMAAADDFAGVFKINGTGNPQSRWLISGNEAAALGAVRGGIRFAAAYPITPATEILEWLAPSLKRLGGTLVQAEDELASINMVIGASFGGTPAITATSGPGLALMIEALGLAVAAEIPLVVIDVMRVGPSTGIPTKSEQSDLNIAVYGLHGDVPHIVVAPTSIGDCVFTTQWAVHLAEATQGPAIVLSDQFLGQARTIIDEPATLSFLGSRKTAAMPPQPYQRYALGQEPVSAMAIPGVAGGQYTADGLVHTPSGTPSSQTEDHREQLDKRRRKIEDFDYGDHWAEIEGEGSLALITWGATTGPVLAAARQARDAGIAVKTITLRLIAPALPDAMSKTLDGVEEIIVVEQNDSGQLHHYLRAYYDLPGAPQSLCQAGPLPIRTSDVLTAISHGRTA
jgi:2-oxoglutarate ferredoxin oxidoreductase subunit alpha